MEIYNLPQELIEISGIIDVDSAFFAIQDESGSIYQLATDDFTIRNRYKFAWPGDYEALVGRQGGIWVVDSRGILFDLTKNENSFHVNNILQLPDSKYEFEGVWKDPGIDNLFLISRKSQKHKRATEERYIWIFDPIEKNFQKNIRIPVEEIWQRLLDFSNIQTWRYTVNINLPFSDLTRDLNLEHWLILCSKPAAVIVLNREGNLLDVIELDNKTLPQPEALCFDHDGNLIIASEGLLGPARIVKFKKSEKE